MNLKKILDLKKINDTASFPVYPEELTVYIVDAFTTLPIHLNRTGKFWYGDFVGSINTLITQLEQASRKKVSYEVRSDSHNMQIIFFEKNNKQNTLATISFYVRIDASKRTASVFQSNIFNAIGR